MRSKQTEERVRCLMCGMEDFVERVTRSTCMRDTKALNMDVERITVRRETPGVDWRCLPLRR